MKRLAIMLILMAMLRVLQLVTGWEIPLVKWLDVSAQAIGGLCWTMLSTTLTIFGVTLQASTSKAWQGFWTGTFATWSVNLLCLGSLFMGLWLLKNGDHLQWDPLTVKRWKRFRSLRRGYLSLWILLALVFVALLDNVLVGKRALIVSHDGHLRCPFLEAQPIMGREFGVVPAESETDYRGLKRRFQEANRGDWVLLPLVPYDSRGDTPPVLQIIENRSDGRYCDQDQSAPFTGSAFIAYRDHPDIRRKELRFREGRLHGTITENDLGGNPVARVDYESGVETKRTQLNPHDPAQLDAAAASVIQRIAYAPTSPSFRHRHFLGTDSSGADVLAQVIGAFQLIIGGTLFFCTVVYVLGILIGGITGYLGGITDLVSQRLIEIWSSLPFLYIVILLRALNERPSLLFVITALAAFGWMGIAAYMRTATFREKNRDYVAAARLLGASNSRMVLTHILPNTLSILITLLPFKVDLLIGSLTSLDYLGYGLPVGEPSWGTLLKDGVANLDKPWILISAFSALALILVLVTFIGEAIREAFDPRKFSYYA